MAIKKSKLELRTDRITNRWLAKREKKIVRKKAIRQVKKTKKDVKKPQSLFKQLDEAVYKLKRSSYNDFLKSDYWKAIRGMVLKRDKNKCVVCGTEKNLQVHHSTYKNHFNEHRNLRELHTLCDTHHHEAHCIMEIK